jgi:hypothetical protein
MIYQPTREPTTPVEAIIICMHLRVSLSSILTQRNRADVDAARRCTTGCFRDHRTQHRRGLDETGMVI